MLCRASARVVAAVIVAVAAACQCSAAAKSATGDSAPVVFWTSRGHQPNTTVLALGAGLANATVTACTPPRGFVSAEVLESTDTSIAFVLPGATGGAAAAATYRVCASADGSRCSADVSVNAADPWWVQGDDSSTAAPQASQGGWIKVYGRGLGFTSGSSARCAPGVVGRPSVAAPGTTTAVLTPLGDRLGSGGATKLAASAASCYDATFAVPVSLPAGKYSLALGNALVPPGLASEAGLGAAVAPNSTTVVTIVAPRPWPTKPFPVAAGARGPDVVAAASQAAASGGGVVALPAGVIDMANASLALGNSVSLVGHPSGGTVLRWTQPTTSVLVANAPGGSEPTRYAVRNLTIDVAAPAKGFVLGVGGHGVRIDGVTVDMPHSLTSAASVVHTIGTGFEITRCNMTHDQLTCTSPGYPRDCLLFFDAGTDGGLVSNNTFRMGCCAFEGYSASGVLLEDNEFVDLPWGVQPDGNGFATFGSKTRVSERLSFSRNTYEGVFNGTNVRDGSFPHEAFTSDGSGGAFTGRPTAWTDTSVTIPSKADASYVGGALAVVAGSGEGQVTRVTKATGSTYTFDPSLAVPLSNDSVVVIAPYVGAVLMMGNVLSNSTTVQIFGCGFDTVYAGNRLEHMFSTSVVHPGGLALMALDYQGGYQPNMHFEVVNNTVADVTGGVAVMIDGNPSNITLSIGHVVRDNVVVGHRPPPSQFSNVDGAVTIGVNAEDPSCGCTGPSRWNRNTTACCFGSVRQAISKVVVEGNAVVIEPSAGGNCARNGVRVFADAAVDRANTCSVAAVAPQSVNAPRPVPAGAAVSARHAPATSTQPPSIPVVVVVWTTNPALPNETAMIRFANGSGLPRTDTSVRLCIAGASATCATAPLTDAWSTGAAFVVPAELPLGAYTVTSLPSGAAVTTLNQADPWWSTCTDGDARPQPGTPTDCKPGSTLWVFGRGLAFDKQECVAADAPAPALAAATLTAPGGTSSPTRFESTSTSCSAASFALPADLAPGTYDLAVSNTLDGATATAAGRSDPTQRRVSVVAPLREVVVGRVPSGNVEALQALLNATRGTANASARVVIELEAGTWLMGPLDDVAVPDGVVLRGSGMAQTKLSWPVQTGHTCLTRKAKWGSSSSGAMVASAYRGGPGAPPALGWGLEDLAVDVRGGLQQNDTKGGICPCVSSCFHDSCFHTARGMTLRRVNVSVIAAKGGVDGYAVNGGVGMGAAVQVTGRDNAIDQCEVTTFGNCGSNVTPLLQLSGNRTLVAASRFRFGCTLYSITSATEVLWKDNNSTEFGGLGRGGSVLATFGPPFRLEYITWLNSTQVDVAYNAPMPGIANPHRIEGLTLDGGGGAYTGGATAVAGSDVVLLTKNPYGQGTGTYAPSRDLHVGANWEGAALVVLEGAGEGQWRRVVANHNRTWRVDTPLDVALDSTSLVQVGPLRGHVLLLGSSWTTSLTVQLYGICLHAVVAGCSFDTTPLLSWGRSPHMWGYQPNWNVELMGNRLVHSRGISTVTCDQKFNLCGEGANVGGLFNGALNTGVRVARNVLAGGEGVSVRGTSFGFSVELNRFFNASGTFAEQPVQVNRTHAAHVLLRANG